jgi:hypothetical protein
MICGAVNTSTALVLKREKRQLSSSSWAGNWRAPLR